MDRGTGRGPRGAGLSAFYLRHLRSPYWKRFRASALRRAGYRCAACSSRLRLEVHHLSYRNLGRELPSDVIVLCPDCHPIADRLRKERR